MYRMGPARRTVRGLKGCGADDGSVSQWYDRLVSLTERCYMLKAAVWLLNQHHGAVAEYGVASFSHVPHSAGAGMLRDCVVKWRAQGYYELGAG